MRTWICLILCVALLAVPPIATAAAEQPDAAFFALFDLELPQLSGVKDAVSKSDYPLALSRLLEYYKTRATPVWYTMPRAPRINTGYNRTNVDQIMKHQFTYYSLEGCPDLPGTSDINWTYTPNGDPEWYWALNRHFALKDLTVAYQETSEDKYAAEFAAQFRDWYADNPAPSELDRSGTWRTIEAGLRLSESMITYFNNLLYCSAVTDDTKMLILKSLHDHGEYLSSFSGSGNWLLFECRGLYALATVFPEFRQAEKWENLALGRLEEEYHRQFLADGWQFELTANYHIEAAKSVYQVQEIAAMNGKNLPFAAQLGKSFGIAQKLLLPGGKVNPTNDTSYLAAHDFLYQGAAFAQNVSPQEVGGYLYAASEYTSGSGDLLESSSADEIAGNAHFRDFYGKDGIYGYFEAGPSGVGSHGFNSKDKLQFTLSAYDRELLVDPGVYSYAGQDIAKYMFTTQAHNTVTIDDLEQVRRTQDVSQKAPGFVFESGPFLDYAEGVYDETFSETQHVPVTHKRKVLFVKSGYFVVRDEVTGTGSHVAKQNWNFAPGDYVIDKQTGVVHTQFSDANVMILPLAFEGLEEHYGSTAPLRGWCTSGANVAVPSLHLAYQKAFTGSGVMEAVVIPYRGSQPPAVQVRRSGGHIVVAFDTYQDTIVLENGDYTKSGTAALVRDTSNGVRQAAVLPPQSSVSQGGGTLSLSSPQARTRSAAAPLASNTGMVQAEWNGVTLEGGAAYCYNEKASERACVALASGDAVSLLLPEGTSGMQIVASGQAGILELWREDTRLSRLTVDGDSFRSYAVSGLQGGRIQIRCTGGAAELDYFKLSGNDTEDISMHAVRQRMANPYSLASFGSAQDTNGAVQAQMKLHSSLRANDKGAMGLVLRGGYRLRYDFNGNQLQIVSGERVLAQAQVVLQPEKWYTFAFRAQGTTLTGDVYDAKQNQLGSVTAQDSAYTSGIGGIFSEYADCSADDVTYNGRTETFETTRIGARPNNWVDSAGGVWRVSAYREDDMFSISLQPGSCVLEHTPIVLSCDISGAYTQPVLYCNGEAIASVTQPEIAVNARLGRMQFWLEAQKNGGTVRSGVVTVDVLEDVTSDKGDYEERFDGYMGGFPGTAYQGTAEKLTSVVQNGSTALEIINSSGNAELYVSLPSILTGYVTTELDVTPKTLSATIPLLLARDTDGKEAYVLAFEKNGVIVNKASGDTIGSYRPNQTYHVRIDYKLLAGTFDIYIDGAAVSRDTPMPAALTGVRRLYLAKVWSVGGAVIDNLKVCQIAPAQFWPLVIRQNGVTVVNTQVYHPGGALYAAVYDESGLRAVYDVSQTAEIAVEQPCMVKIFCFEALKPLKSAAVYDFRRGAG